MYEFNIEEETRAEMILVVIEETPECWDANADWRNGFYPPNPEDKPMAQVTYRGVKYDTDTRKADAPAKSDMVYRGVKHSKREEFVASYLDA